MEEHKPKPAFIGAGRSSMNSRLLMAALAGALQPPISRVRERIWDQDSLADIPNHDHLKLNLGVDPQARGYTEHDREAIARAEAKRARRAAKRPSPK